MRSILSVPRWFGTKVFFASCLILITFLSLSPIVDSANAADHVTLAWDANSEDNLAGYKLYYKVDAGGAPYDGTGVAEGDSPVTIYLDDLDDATEPTFTLTELGEGQTYYFALTAFNTDGLESDYSDEVSYETASANTYVILASATGQGDISPEGTVSVTEGESQTFTFDAGENYHILEVLVDGVSAGQVSEYTFDSVGASHSIEAVFELDTYTITAVSGENGTITPSGVESAGYGSSLTYTISPDDNYHVSDVLVDGVSVGKVASYTFDALSASHTIEATFAIDTFTITATSAEGGSISPAGVTTVNSGGGQSYLITPDENYHILEVLVDGVSAGQVSAYTFTGVSASHSIEAVFEIDTYTITAVSGENGTITPSGVESAGYGSSLTYTISPDDNYHVSDVLVDGVSVGKVASYTFDALSASHTIEAVFELDTFTIVASITGEGSISPAGTIEVAYGADQVYTVVPGEGQIIEEVTVDGQSVGAVEAYTFASITENHVIGAVFVAKDPEFAMEVGSVVAGGDVQQVSFESTFANPVVVAATLTAETAASVVVRVDNVTATGFDISAGSWAETDTTDFQDTIGYVVMEAGSFTLPDGTLAEAEIFVSEDTTAVSGVEFMTVFNQVPATGATITTSNDPAAVKAVLQNISATGFEYSLQEQVVDSDGHLSEMVSYIALEEYLAPLSDAMIDAGLTEEVLTFARNVIALSQPAANGVDTGTDTETPDTGTDTETPDTGTDTETPDAGTDTETPDTGTDTETSDTGTDTTVPDSDTGTDTTDPDAGTDTTPDAGTDTTTPDTGNQVPGSPVAVSSSVSSAGIGPIELVVYDRFADPDTGDYHAGTEWQVFQVASGVCVLSSVSSNALTTFSVPEIMLAASTEYSWRARFYDNNDGASAWSETAYFSTGTSTTDLDGNGLPDDQETDATVDMNLDGVPDVEQETIQSILIPSTSQPIGLEINDGGEGSATAILSMEAITAESLPVADNIRSRALKLPNGLINYKVAVAEPGDTAVVTVYFADPAHPRARWMKLDLVNNVWIDYTGYVQFSEDRKSVSIELVDGGFGDDDGVANGVIVDPSGIEVAAAEETTETTEDDSTGAAAADSNDAGDSGGGCFISGAVGETVGMPMAMVSILMFLCLSMICTGRRKA